MIERTGEAHMLIDCAGCPVRRVHCDDCIVTVLATIPVGAPADSPAAWTHDHAMLLDVAEQRAVDLFVRAGLVGRDHAATLWAVRTPDPKTRTMHEHAAATAVAAGW